MVTDMLAALSLSPGAAAWIGGMALVLIVALDVFASGDDVEGNTPREWLLRLTQWRSMGFWDRQNREAAKAAGSWNAWLAPFNAVPITGAIVPFGLACVTGHFFHPWSAPPLGIAGFRGLFLATGLGLAFSFVTYTGPFGIRGERLTPIAALLGLVAGVLLWPVG